MQDTTLTVPEQSRYYLREMDEAGTSLTKHCCSLGSKSQSRDWSDLTSQMTSQISDPVLSVYARQDSWDSLPFGYDLNISTKRRLHLF